MSQSPLYTEAEGVEAAVDAEGGESGEVVGAGEDVYEA